jgi:hypothetical protein
MVRISFFIWFLLLPILSCFAGYCAQPPRPYTGIGLLTIRPFVQERAADAVSLSLYAYPGVKRVTEIKTAAIPALEPIIRVTSGEYAIGVTGKKGNWVRIVYDDAGREGWLEMEPHWAYTPWETFLKGRFAVLLPNLRNSWYLLRKESSESSEPIVTLSSRQKLQIIQVEGDRAKVMVDGITAGWLNWRDPEGKWIITLEGIVP